MNARLLKFGLPMMAPMSAMRMSLVNDVMTAPNAPPMTTPTARSTMFPRLMKSLNPLIMTCPLSRVRRTR